MEDIDLNSLRPKHTPETTPLSKEETVTELEKRILELENTTEPPGMLETFNALSSEDQQLEVDRIIKNRNLGPGSYSVEIRREELHTRDQGPSLRRIRIEALKLKLNGLMSKS